MGEYSMHVAQGLLGVPVSEGCSLFCCLLFCQAVVHTGVQHLHYHICHIAQVVVHKHLLLNGCMLTQ
jgi:hypothetical protein